VSSPVSRLGKAKKETVIEKQVATFLLVDLSRRDLGRSKVRTINLRLRKMDSLPRWQLTIAAGFGIWIVDCAD
jgi:hypothetical protein